MSKQKTETTEGAEPEAKNPAIVAAGNAQNAENTAAAAVERGKQESKAADDRTAAEKLLAKIEAERAEMNQKLAELDRKQSELAQRLDKPGKQPVTVKLRATALNPRKALAHLADIFPDDGQRPTPTAIVARIFRVKPIGSASAELPIAEVSNCSDEGDAIARYAQHTGRHAAVEVELIGQETYTEATADPASAVA